MNQTDSVIFVDFMKHMGYVQILEMGNKLCFSNSVDFIEVDFIEVDFQAEVEIPTITTVYMELKNESKSERIEIGKSIIYIEGNKATWDFNLGSK